MIIISATYGLRIFTDWVDDVDDAFVSTVFAAGDDLTGVALTGVTFAAGAAADFVGVVFFTAFLAGAFAVATDVDFFAVRFVAMSNIID